MANEFTEIGRKLVQKWEGLVEDIENPTVRINTAILLENEAQKGGILIEDSSGPGTQSGQPGGGPGFGAQTGAGNDIAPFQHYLLPLVRRVYPNLIANELVGVQPMTSPASLVFYLKYRYSGLVDPDTVTGGRVVPTQKNKGRTAPDTEYGNFIGNTWNIDPYYSLQKVFREPLTAVTDFDASTGAVGGYSLLATPHIANVPSVLNYTITVDDDGGGAGTATSVVAFTVVEGSTTATNVRVVSGAVTSTQLGSITLGAAPAISGSDVLTAGAVSVGGVATISSVDSVNVTYEYNMEGNRTLPEIELEVSSDPVTAQQRKLRTKWTIEASQDLRAMHNIDAEQELVALLANEVTAEIDREIINDLIINALIRVEYDYSNPFIVGGTTTVDQSTAAATQVAVTGVTSFDDRNKSLFYQILEVSNQIYRQSLRGAGNWIVTSPEVAAKLESLLEFKPDARTDFQYNMGIQFSGTLNGQFRVFKDPLFPRDLILVGFKGNSFMDSGYFYCPYIPLQLTPTVLDPESFNPRKGLVTRYGKVLVENGGRMYGVIRVNGLVAVGANELPGTSQVNAQTVDTQKNTVGGPGSPESSELI